MRERELVLFGYTVVAGAAFVIGSYIGEYASEPAAYAEVAVVETVDPDVGMTAASVRAEEIVEPQAAYEDSSPSEPVEASEEDAAAAALAEAERAGSDTVNEGGQSESGWDNSKWGNSEWDNSTWDNAGDDPSSGDNTETASGDDGFASDDGGSEAIGE